MAENNKRSNAVRLLAILEAGVVVEKNDRRWAIRDGKFGMLGNRWDSSKETFDEFLDHPEEAEEVFLPMTFSIDNLIGWADQFTDDELFILGANKVLQELVR